MQWVDKELRSFDQGGERVRNRSRVARRPGGEQGWRTLLPELGQRRREQDPVLWRQPLGGAAKSYKGSGSLAASALSSSPYSPECVEGGFCELRRDGVLGSSLPGWCVAMVLHL